MKKELVTKLIAVRVSGNAILDYWDGNYLNVDMAPMQLRPEKATKDNILRCVNDGAFGCKRIVSADITLEAVYDNGGVVFITEWEIDHPVHTALFLGWQELRRQKAYFNKYENE